MIDSVWLVQYMRQVAILDRLRAEGALTVDQLSAATSASRATIRRDLDTLESAGVINRVHGGAVLRADSGADGDLTRPFAQVVTADSEDKTAIARLAAGLVNDGDVVLLDIGTTTMRLAVELRGRTITVITANLAVLDVFRDDVNVELILLGGQVRRQYHSLVGALTQEALRHVRATIGFLGASGVRRDGTVLDSTAVEVPVKQALLGAAQRSVLLVDRHKFPGAGALRVCGIDDVDVLVTNAGADPDALDGARRAGVDVRTT
ncbi:MAG: DeoR/GlpR family DNA-binding transcription regulator [Ilumatobacteraceae bacterium]